MKKLKICVFCGNEFYPSKNDDRIKFCSKKCREEYRKQNKYNTEWANRNREYVRKYRERTKDVRNSRRRERYASDEKLREKIIKESKEYRKRHPLKKKDNDLKSNYGIGIDEYIEMMKQQDYKCAICGCSITEKGKQINVDHDHNTGKIRGILCTNCNFGIGHFKDNIYLLKKAIHYLEENDDGKMDNLV